MRYYYIQLTVKYRKALLEEEGSAGASEAAEGFKERDAMKPSTVRTHIASVRLFSIQMKRNVQGIR
ncbi:MAG TPA: hypothetical protein DCP92_08505 [Nitrospiraceae bacterium]|nr:hypothetical protein [Nitrospiraceae bacterium]